MQDAADKLDQLERGNAVCLYQMTPMYEGIWHVSRPRGTTAPFPLPREAFHMAISSG